MNALKVGLYFEWVRFPSTGFGFSVFDFNCALFGCFDSEQTSEFGWAALRCP